MLVILRMYAIFIFIAFSSKRKSFFVEFHRREAVICVNWQLWPVVSFEKNIGNFVEIWLLETMDRNLRLFLLCLYTLCVLGFCEMYTLRVCVCLCQCVFKEDKCALSCIPFWQHGLYFAHRIKTIFSPVDKCKY